MGRIFVLEEDDPARPGRSTGFSFWQVWEGTEGTGPFDVANPDNLAIDRDGGVWFGTDGNYGRNGTADALYYLDLNPAHATYGTAFRFAAGPSRLGGYGAGVQRHDDHALLQRAASG